MPEKVVEARSSLALVEDLSGNIPEQERMSSAPGKWEGVLV